MTTASETFDLERDGNTLIVAPRGDLRELDYARIEDAATEVLHMVGNGQARNVVLDFHQTDYYGSTALGFFVKLWKRVRSGGGNMAFCNLSDHEREILAVTRLDQLWPVCASRAEALVAVRDGAPAGAAP